jgi:hypothetical protein
MVIFRYGHILKFQILKLSKNTGFDKKTLFTYLELDALKSHHRGNRGMLNDSADLSLYFDHSYFYLK